MTTTRRRLLNNLTKTDRQVFNALLKATIACDDTPIPLTYLQGLKITNWRGVELTDGLLNLHLEFLRRHGFVKAVPGGWVVVT